MVWEDVETLQLPDCACTCWAQGSRVPMTRPATAGTRRAEDPSLTPTGSPFRSRGSEGYGDARRELRCHRPIRAISDGELPASAAQLFSVRTSGRAARKERRLKAPIARPW